MTLATGVALWPACDGGGAGVVIPPAVVGARCFDYSRHIRTAGVAATGAPVLALSADGDRAYAALGRSGLAILDVSDASNPFVLGTLDTVGAVNCAGASGGIAVVGLSGSGVIVVDGRLSPGWRVSPVVQTPGVAGGIVLKSGRAYIADGDVGLLILDVSNADSIAVLGVENTPGRAEDVVLSGRFAYVADLVLGLRVDDVADPTRPWLVASLPSLANATRVGADGNRVFVAVRDVGVVVVDASLAFAPVVVDTLVGDASAGPVAVGAIRVAVGTNAGAELFERAGGGPERALGVVPSLGRATDVAWSNGYLLVGESNGDVRIAEVSNRDAVPVAARLETAGAATHIALDGDYAFALTDDARMVAARWLGEGRLEAIGDEAVSIDYAGLVAADRRVFVADGRAGVAVFDVEPDGVTRSGRFDVFPRAESVTIADSLAYVATGGEYVSIHKLGRTAPIGEIQLRGIATRRIAVSRRYAYVASEQNELYVLDVDDPTKPLFLWRVDVEGAAVDMAVVDTLIYLVTSDETAGGGSGIAVYDLSIPVLPRPAAFYPLRGTPSGAAFAAREIYISVGKLGVETHTTAGRWLGVIPPSRAARGAAVGSGRVFIADDAAGIFVAPSQTACAVP